MDHKTQRKRDLKAQSLDTLEQTDQKHVVVVVDDDVGVMKTFVEALAYYYSHLDAVAKICLSTLIVLESRPCRDDVDNAVMDESDLVRLVNENP